MILQRETDGASEEGGGGDDGCRKKRGKKFMNVYCIDPVLRVFVCAPHRSDSNSDPIFAEL